MDSTKFSSSSLKSLTINNDFEFDFAMCHGCCLYRL